MCYYASVLKLDMHQEFHRTEYPVTRFQCKYQQYNVNTLCNQRRPDHNKISIPWRRMNSTHPTKSKLDLEPASLASNCIIFPPPKSKTAGRWIHSLRPGTHYPHVTWAHVMLRVPLGCERRFDIELYGADSHFCHSAYVAWSHVELWSAHVPARLSYFCRRTHFVRREITRRKQSDRCVNLRHRIQCQIASHIPTARVTLHELTWREDSVSPA
jgi:hypothetical protein